MTSNTLARSFLAADMRNLHLAGCVNNGRRFCSLVPRVEMEGRRWLVDFTLVPKVGFQSQVREL